MNPSVPDVGQLLGLARDALAKAYAPYSSFPVGAALLAEDGQIFTGCNIENASFGLTMCAERVAIYQAVASGVTRFRAVAIVASRARPCSPCGACRQVLAEFGATMDVILESPEGPCSIPLTELLPMSFTPSDLARSPS